VDDLPRQELRSLIARRGIAACLDPRRFEDELAGVCGRSEKEVFVLVAALRKDVVSELVRGSDPSPIDVRVARFADRLYDIGVERRAADWAAETWAFALGLLGAVEHPTPPGMPAVAARIEYQCPHCHEVGAAEMPGRVVCRCGWISVIGGDGMAREPEDLIVVRCPSCKEEGQHAPDGYVECDSCGKWIRLGEGGCVLNEVEVSCPNPQGDCGTTHQFRRAGLPKQVECDSCGWTFDVDADGTTRSPEGLYDVTCPFCERDSQHPSAGEVECYQPGCGKTLVIDEHGHVLNRTIEAECPRGCGAIQDVERAGRVVCDGCGHTYTIDEDGDVADPGEGVWEVECDNPDCKETFYKEACSEAEHLAGGYECPYCGHWHGHEGDEEVEDELNDEIEAAEEAEPD